jgi:hypothetical protein
MEAREDIFGIGWSSRSQGIRARCCGVILGLPVAVMGVLLLYLWYLDMVLRWHYVRMSVLYTI